MMYDYRSFNLDSYRNSTGLIDAEFGKFKNLSDFYMNLYNLDDQIELINPHKTFIGCDPMDDYLYCLMGFSTALKLRTAGSGEAGSQCPPRFKGENGLCVPKDPSKHTFWGTEDQLLEDVNYMRGKIAKEFGIPNMHQLTWNESLVEILKRLDLESEKYAYIFSNDSSWNGVGKSWRITELLSFSAAVAAIEEEVYRKLVLNQDPETTKIRGKEDSITRDEMIHPLQTSIGCMKKERKGPGYRKKVVLTACLLGNMGQWPSGWKWDANSKKIPGSECMDGYVNDDGLCVVAPPTSAPKPIPNVPKNPEAPAKESVAVESEQEKVESSSTANLSYGLWIIYLFLSFF